MGNPFRKRLLLALSLVAVLPGCFLRSAWAAWDPLEYDVYDAVMRQMYLRGGVERIVIRGETVPLSGPLPGVEINLDAVAGSWGLDSTIVDQYSARNRQAYRLTENFHIGVRCVLVSQADLEKATIPAAFWENFRAAYPGAQGLMELSRVGFNQKNDQAILYVGNRDSELSGSGQIILLVKDSGLWRIQKVYRVWGP